MKKLVFVLFAAVLLGACASKNQDVVSPKGTACKVSKSNSALQTKSASDSAVARHHFSSSVNNREPLDILDSMEATGDGDLYYFSEYIEMTDSKPSHKWYINEAPVFEKTADVTSPRYRYYTSMDKVNFKKNDVVRVDIVDENGKVIASDTITVK
jgi:hypothetical protein